MNIKETSWYVVTAFLVLALLAIAAVGMIGAALNAIPEGRFLPEIALTILLLAGVVALIAILVITVAVFAALGLSDRTQAFGMPEGSVRAVIALSLILIFAIMAVFLYNQLRETPTTTITGLTQEQMAEIPAQEIIASRPSEAGENLFDVQRRLERNETSEDFAKQLLTTISTLVVAVAGFYFGSKAVAAAKGEPEQPTLSILRPDSPAKLKKDMSKLTIRLETEPTGLAIEGRVNGDVDASLKQIRHDEFEYYRPDEIPVSPVTLTFSLAVHPKVTKSLTVEFEPELEPTPPTPPEPTPPSPPEPTTPTPPKPTTPTPPEPTPPSPPEPTTEE
jgi:hypothetical protein